MIRVLIADDHALMREGMKRILAATGDILTIGEASSGEEALDMLERIEADLLMLDLSMPGVRGIDLIAAVRTAHPGMPMLVVSMHNEGEIVSRAIAAGAGGYVTKDSDPTLLPMAIRKVATGARYVSPAVLDALAFGMPAVRPHAPAVLTPRELQVLKLVASGVPLVQVAESLNLSPKTISAHKRNLMIRLGIANNADLIRYAISHGLVSE